MKPEKLSRRTVYEHYILDVYEDVVRYPGGKIIKDHIFLHFKNRGVGVVVRDEKGNFLFVESYRYILDTAQWEIPAGSGSAGESSIATAQREVLEETGYEATDFKLFYSYYPTNGVANQVFELYSCLAVKKVQDFDAVEVRDVRWFSEVEVREMIKRAELKDGFSLAGVLLALNNS